MKFTTKQIEVEAIRYNPDLDDHAKFMKPEDEWYDDDIRFVVVTKIGDLFAYPGDWIIRLPNGDYRICSANDFNDYYELSELPKMQQFNISFEDLDFLGELNPQINKLQCDNCKIISSNIFWVTEFTPNPMETRFKNLCTNCAKKEYPQIKP